MSGKIIISILFILFFVFPFSLIVYIMKTTVQKVNQIFYHNDQHSVESMAI